MSGISSLLFGWWRRTSIRTKMQMSILGFALLVLLVCAITLTVAADLYFHQKMRQDLQMLGKVLAENSGAALTFNDADSARKVLGALKENENVEAAALYSEGGGFAFAEYPGQGAAAGLEVMAGRADVWLQDDFYITSVPVMVNEQAIGQLVLKSNLREWELFQQNLTQLFMMLFIGLVLLTLLVSYWLKTHITHPLASLSEWAMQVSRHKDFNARASKRNDDEIGQLVDSLNVMLKELARQETIVTLNRELEREIQERKLIESDLIAMRNRAEEANRAKSRFLANMSHELRTPLNAIIGYSEMLQEIVAEDEFEAKEILQDIGKVRAAGKHLLSLINDILDISKIEAGKMQIDIEAFSMEDLIREVVDTIRPLADERQNRLVVTGGEEAGVVHSDMVKVRQILFNLLSNAVKFTHQGEVVLSFVRESDDNDEWIVCKVRDTGIGISHTSLQELFKPFSQADPSTTRKYGGTGLGLAISRSYVSMLGGEIRADSEEGKGSEFTVWLPVTARIGDEEEDSVEVETPSGIAHLADRLPSTPPGEDRQSPSDDCWHGETQLLLIDDDEAIHDRLRHQLGRHGFVIHSAWSGEEGLALARTLSVDVIVLDIFMPEMDGWQVLQTLKSEPQTAQTPVVMYTVEPDETKSFALGASDYLVKPINGQRLLNILQRYKKPNHSLKVLSIDDDIHSQDLIRAYLNGPDWEVTVAGNGREGLKVLQAHSDFAVILLDLVMPEMNGFEFLEECRKGALAENIPIIVISARDLSQQERQLLVRYTQAVIRKGMYDKNTLIGRIKRILDEQLPLQATASNGREGGSS